VHVSGCIPMLNEHTIPQFKGHHADIVLVC
jgi:hypothetical protein